MNVWMKRVYTRIETSFMGFERKKHSLRLQSLGESLEGIETLASLSNFFFFFFLFTPRESWKVTRYKIETLAPRADDQTYFQSHVSFPTSASPFRTNFYQLFFLRFLFFLLFFLYVNFVVNLDILLFCS